jgi:predicted phosphodiesterase
MLLQIASDLHLERLKGVNTVDAFLDRAISDVLVLAGDIHRLDRVARYFADWPVPVVYVHGNHDLYHGDYIATVQQGRAQLAQTNIKFLEEQEMIFDSVRFLGCCLWSDFALHGMAGLEMDYARDYAPDYRIIFNGLNRKLTPADTRATHRHSVDWLDKKLRQPFSGKTVVVTHYAPHPMSLGYGAAQETSSAFASDLSRLLRRTDLWIHGHIHESCDYMWSGCRVVSNPAGYRRHGKGANAANRQFDRGLVIRI